MNNKNYNRSSYTFANINFMGKCNLDCFFCLGKDLKEEFDKYNLMDTHFINFKNLELFIRILKENNIKRVYLTGQNTDSLLYEYLEEFITYLKDKGFFVGLRTNALLAKRKISIINKTDSVGYTLLTLNKEDMKKMTTINKIPDWNYIFKNTKIPYRVSIVVTTYNKPHILNLINFLSRYKEYGLKYCQLRRISTDFRYNELKKHIKAFDELESELNKTYNIKSGYETAPTLEINGLPITLWKTVSTTANSMNYFVNGVISKEYFIIEGYIKNKANIE